MKFRRVPAYVNRPVMLYHLFLSSREVHAPVIRASVIRLVAPERSQRTRIQTVVPWLRSRRIPSVVAEELPAAMDCKLHARELHLCADPVLVL